MRAVGKLLLVLLGLAVLLVVADRLALRAAESTIAARLAEGGQLGPSPVVEVRGTPFLTQALRGRYDDVLVRAEGVPAGDLRVSSFVAELRGLQVPLSDVVQGDVQSVPVDELSARAVITLADLAKVVADRGLQVSPAEGGLVRVTGGVEVFGRRLEASAVSRVALEGNTVVVTAERFEVGNSVADAVLSAALGDRLDFRFELGPLPYGLQVTSLRPSTTGVVLTARSDGAVLQAG